MAHMKFHIKDSTQAQVPRASVHKRVIHTGLPFKAGDSRTRVNHTWRQELSQFFPILITVRYIQKSLIKYAYLRLVSKSQRC